MVFTPKRIINALKIHNFLHLLAIVVFPCFGTFCFGFDSGAASYVILIFKDYDEGGYYDKVANSGLYQGYITFLPAIGAAIGAGICMNKGHIWGQKNQLIVGALLFAFGSSLIIISGYLSWQTFHGFSMMLFGKLFYGFAIGLSCHAMPSYLSEMSPSNLRGIVTSGMESMNLIGVLFGIVCGGIFDEAYGWRKIYILPLLFAFIMVVGLWFLPPSPRWLIINEKSIEEIKRSIEFTSPIFKEQNIIQDEDVYEEEKQLMNDYEENYGSTENVLSYEEEIQKYFQEFVKEVKHGSSMETNIFVSAKKNPPLFKVLQLALSVVIIKQFTAQPGLIYYVGEIIAEVGISHLHAVILAIAFVKLFGNIVCLSTVEYFGRKKLLLFGMIGMFLGMFSLFLLFEYSASNANSAGVIIALFTFFGSYEMGIGPLTWVMIGEIFPFEVKSSAISFVLIINFIGMGLITLIIPIWAESLGFFSLFGCFSLICLCSVLYIHFYVPDFSGLTLEEIQHFIRDGNFQNFIRAKTENDFDSMMQLRGSQYQIIFSNYNKNSNKSFNFVPSQ